jgi:hypothetical protein
MENGELVKREFLGKGDFLGIERFGNKAKWE